MLCGKDSGTETCESAVRSGTDRPGVQHHCRVSGARCCSGGRHPEVCGAPGWWGGLQGATAAWTHGWIWFSGHEWALTLFLVFAGANTAVILWQARRVLKTVLAGTPFASENAVSLRRAAVCCFLIAAAALARVIFSVCCYRSPYPWPPTMPCSSPCSPWQASYAWLCPPSSARRQR